MPRQAAIEETRSRPQPARVSDGAADRRPNRWAVLAVVLSGFFMILLDGTIMNVAIPPLQQDLSASYSAAQWMMSGYALAYGLLLIPAGRLGDRFGQKRLFLIGLAGFTVTSLLCSTATSSGQIVVWRILQGLAAGLMNPAILAMIHAAFEPRERGRAFVWYGAVAGIAAALGPVLGGVLIAWNVHDLSWRPIFLLNLPIGIVALAFAVRVLPEHRGRGGSLDPVGIGLLTTALLLVIYPLIQGYEIGWPAWVFGALGAALPVLGLFVAWEARRLRVGAAPLIDIRLFAKRAFAAGVGVTISQFIAFASLQFALSAYLQLGLGESALATGIALVPFAVGTFVGSSVSNIALRRLGRRALHLGSALLALGTGGAALTVHGVGTTVDALWLTPATFVAGVGALMLGAPIINIVLTDVPGRDAGSAGGIIATAQRVGHALGIAIVGTALFSALPAGAQDEPGGSLPHAYTHAIQLAILYCLGAAALTYALVFLLPRFRPDGAGRPDAEDTP